MKMMKDGVTTLTKDEMLAEYDVDGFFYDLVLVTRKNDGVKGAMKFVDDYAKGQRDYFDFQEM